VSTPHAARRRDRWLPLGALALLVYVPLLLTDPGKVLADTKTYLYLDPGRLLARAVSMWDPHVGLGTVPHQQIGYLWPAGPWYWVFEQLGAPDWVAQRLWLGTILVAAGAGVLFLGRTWRWRPSATVAAAFLYALTPFTLTLDELLGEPMVERHVTLACVSNEVGGSLVGTARWLGVPLARLLERAGVQPTADQVVGRSVDGFTVGFPTAVALDGRDAIVAVCMNGEPLPRRHGFPARLVVPGLYGYVSATKWLTEIRLTTFDAFDAYWIERGWAEEGPVKTQSRIDVPRGRVAAGPVAVAGVAWATHRGISAVEVRVDGGAWQPATLAAAISDDTWRQWHLTWDATPGRHVLEVRATDGGGEVQPAERTPVFPDGATGHHRIAVEVS